MRTLATTMILAFIVQGCAWLRLNQDEDVGDAGDASVPGATCAPKRGVCFAGPVARSTSWGLTSLRTIARHPNESMQTFVAAAQGSSEVVEFEANADGLDIAATFKVASPPWQASLLDWNLDGRDDIAVASPGVAGKAGEVSFWRSTPPPWTLATTQKAGVGTYSLACREKPAAEEIIAVAASYTAQTLLPFVGHLSTNPTPGDTLSVSFKPSALCMGEAGNGIAKLYAAGDDTSQGRLTVFNVVGQKLTKVAESPTFGKSLNDIEIGDLNGDSLVDAVIVDDAETSFLYPLLADPLRGWIVGTPLSLPPNSHAAALDDFDRDGVLDVATVSGSKDTVQVCFGDGNGQFGQCASAPHGLRQPTDIVTAALRTPEEADLVVVGYEGAVSVIFTQPASN